MILVASLATGVARVASRVSGGALTQARVASVLNSSSGELILWGLFPNLVGLASWPALTPHKCRPSPTWLGCPLSYQGNHEWSFLNQDLKDRSP